MVRLVLIVLVCWLFLPASAFADRPMLLVSAAQEEMLRQGRTHMLNFRLQEAEAVFNRLSAQPGGEAAGAYHLATIALWRALVEEEKPYFDDFFRRSDAAMALIDEAPASAWRNQLYADACLQRAIAWMKLGQYRHAALAGRRAHNLYDSNIRRYPEFEESYKGMGLFRVAIGSVPGSYRWLLSILGYRGSVTDGMKDLQRAAANSRYSREEAMVLLSLLNIMLNERHQEAVSMLQELYREYPSSPAVSYLMGFALLSNRQATEAEQVFRAGIEAQGRPGVHQVNYLNYFLAQSLFRQNRFEDAVSQYRVFLDGARGNALIATARINAGLSLEMLGRRDEALVLYRKVQNERDLDSDRYATRLARERIARPMEPHERILLLGMNAYDGGRYRQAEERLKPLFQDSGALPAVRAEAAYRLGRTLHAEGRLVQAIPFYQYAVDNPGDASAKWGPWSQLYIGEVYEGLGQTARARAAYQAALSYRGNFDYHKALEQRAKVAMARL